MGKSTLGLSYGLTFSEVLIAPAMPSTTARAGGVFLPIIKSLSLSAGSEPASPSAKKLGAYLIQNQFQVSSNYNYYYLVQVRMWNCGFASEYKLMPLYVAEYV